MLLSLFFNLYYFCTISFCSFLIIKKTVHGPGPKWGSLDPWSMFCPHPENFGKNLLGKLDLRRDFFGYSKLLKWFFFCVITFNALWKIFMVWKFGMRFLRGLNFGAEIFWGFV